MSVAPRVHRMQRRHLLRSRLHLLTITLGCALAIVPPSSSGALAIEPRVPPPHAIGVAPSRSGAAEGVRLKAVDPPLAPVRVRMQDAWDIAVTSDRVFLSSAYEDEVVVLDHAGRLLERLTVATPIGLLVLNETLYVASWSTGSILRFDLSSDPPVLIDSLTTTGVTNPEYLAYAAGRIWYSANCTSSSTQFGSMTPNGSNPTVFTPSSVASGCPQPWSGSFAPNTLIVGFDQAYDVASDPPVLLSQGGPWRVGAWAFVPGGGLVLAGNADGDVEAFDPGDLSTVVSTWTGRASAALAMSPAGDGSFASAGRPGSGNASFVQIYHQADSSPFATYRLNGDPNFGRGADIHSRMLEFTPDGSKLFVFSSYGQAKQPSYLNIVDPSLPGTALSITSPVPRRITGGTRLTVRGTTVGIASGEAVDLYLRDAEGQNYRLGTGTVADNGTVEISAKPTVSGRLFLGYDGTATTAPSEGAPANVGVAPSLVGRMVGGYRTAGVYRYFHEATNVIYVVRTKPNLAGSRVNIRLQFDKGAGWRSGGSGRFKVRDDGAVAIGWRGGSLPRYRYRLQTTTDATSDFLAGSSTWTYFAVSA